MRINHFFRNVSWDNGAIYNIEAVGKGACGGGADIEHHMNSETPQAIVWVQKESFKDPLGDKLCGYKYKTSESRPVDDELTIFS